MTSNVIIDMFCGAGGESTGIHQACAEIGFKQELYAINHWERAIETHSKNYPDAEHICEDVDRVDPVKTVKGGKVALLWASPECTHHSNARGGRPRSDQSRASAWQILKWAQELNIQRIIVENVPEFQSWGPLNDKGLPVKKAKGQTFQAWLNSLRSLGYTVDYQVLNAADYGDPTTRRRLFVQAVKGGKKILWPEASHAETPDMFCAKKWRAAEEIIDWRLKSELISERKKPLAENTMKRIEAGIRKFWGEYAEPFLTSFHGGNPDRNYRISEPIPTLDTSNRFGLVEPFIFTMGHSKSVRVNKVSRPLSTVVTKDEHYLLQPFVMGQQSCASARAVSNPLPTVATAGAISLVQPFILKYYGCGENVESVMEPLDTVVTKDRFALVQGGNLGILFRMLQPHELSGAQGFPRDYKFAGTKTEIVKQIGNAVPCNTAKALCKSILGGS